MASQPGRRKPALVDRAPFPLRTLLGLLHESRASWRISADIRSALRLLMDMLLFRVIGVIDLPGRDSERRIKLRAGPTITYRLNRGDYQSIREVWMDERYRLPFEISPDVIVDLGANIGLTSLYLDLHYRPARMIAVEPSPDNARLTRKNFSMNGLDAEVIEAAIGPSDGTGLFEKSVDSNLGRLGARGETVALVSMKTILSKLPEGVVVGVVKMDIEGGEQELLSRNRDWLARVNSIVAEFHPEAVDYPGLIAILEREGFRYLRPEETGVMDCFVRPGSVADTARQRVP